MERVMAGSDAQRSEIEAKLAMFDDDAIRVELRRMVSDCEARMLADFVEKEDEMKSEMETIENVDEEVKQKVLAKFAESKSFVPLYFHKIYEFIDRR
jgi:methanogenic corrinoid protein MtbC1